MVEQGPESIVGRILDGRYRVESRIGSGGMGDVYRAVHQMLGSTVALKVLATDRAQQPDAARRFVREAKSAFRLDHPHCMRVTDLGADDGVLYIVMEYLDGRTAGAELAVDGPMASARVAHIGGQIGRAVAQAHKLGLVHRDLKPDNIMLVHRDDDPDYVKVLDFGLARVFDEHGDLSGTAVSLSPLTKDGMVFGTPAYMSPEQASGTKVGPASDVYSLGAVLYHLLTGSEPFTGRHFMEVLTQHVRKAPVPPSQLRPDLPIDPALEATILHCLAKDQSQRPNSADAVAASLEALGDHRPTRPPLAPSSPLPPQGSAGMVTVDLEAVPHSPPSPSTAELSELVRGPRTRKMALVATFAVVAAGLLVWSQSGERGSTGTTGSPADDAGAVAAYSPVPAPLDSGTPRQDAGSISTTTDLRQDAAVGQPPTSADRRTKSAAQLKAEQHVRSAETARSAGNLLRQLAEADAARGLDPSNRRARELLGEALVKSGDLDRGCPLLRRTSLHRRLGCTD